MEQNTTGLLGSVVPQNNLGMEQWPDWFRGLLDDYIASNNAPAQRTWDTDPYTITWREGEPHSMGPQIPVSDEPTVTPAAPVTPAVPSTSETPRTWETEPYTTTWWEGRPHTMGPQLSPQEAPPNKDRWSPAEVDNFFKTNKMGITRWGSDPSVYNIEVKPGQWNGGPMPASGAVASPVPASAPATKPPETGFKGLMSGLKLQKPEHDKQPQFSALTPHRPDPMSVKKLMEMYRGGLLR